ncbi:hypothetical protein ISN76_11720 [Dyella halodurans]|uniref:Uncharacterized protein n=1 Tax=Dyella halodurans TaxID=1920171 RepID=A0ABV9C152_9GAMM|nr:hypothetical protein [Dyella halodurans]
MGDLPPTQASSTSTLRHAMEHCKDGYGGPTMGCLPLPILFVLGFLIGKAVGGSSGALWGAGLGLVLGLLLAGLFITLVRRRR